MLAQLWNRIIPRVDARRRVVVWLALALAFPVAPSAARADDVGGTNLTWWACPGDRHAAPGVPFDCIAESGAVYTLIGSFTLESDVTNVVSMEADVNFAFPGLPVIPQFWEVDLGGCNSSSFSLVKGMPENCGEHLNAFCGGDSNQCDLLYSAYVFPNSNVLRLSITAARGANTVNLAGGQRYFAFAINIPMSGAAGCFGCTTPCAIGFSRAWINSVDDNGLPRPPATVSGTHPGAVACATANDGYSECTTVPVRRMTWGRLKSLYR